MPYELLLKQTFRNQLPKFGAKTRGGDVSPDET